jgi:hypothetical protein
MCWKQAGSGRRTPLSVECGVRRGECEEENEDEADNEEEEEEEEE